MKVFVVLISFLILSCEKKDPTLVLVNGVSITEAQLKEAFAKSGDDYDKIPLDQKEVLVQQKLDQLVARSVVDYEVKRLGTTEQELFSFFDQLKTRQIETSELEMFLERELKGGKDLQKESKDEIVNLMRLKQFDSAKEKYMSELKKRSTIRYINK